MTRVEVKRWLARSYPEKSKGSRSVLTYHSVGGPSPFSLPAALFAEHVAAIKETAVVQTTAEIVRPLQDTECGAGREAKPVTAITFDDGYRDVLEVAAPVLHAAGMPFTVFVTTGLMGDPNMMSWSPHYRGVPALSWNALRDLRKSGAIIGAHTCSHRRLSALAVTEVEREIRGSKELIEDKLGVGVDVFAYPFGQRHDYDKRCTEIVAKAGFSAAYSTIQRTFRRRDKIFEVPRLTVSEDYGPTDVIDLMTARYNYLSFYGSVTSGLVRMGLRRPVEQSIPLVES